MPTKPCCACGVLFNFKEGEEWKTYCIPCFKAKKNKERAQYNWQKDQKERVVYRDKVIYKDKIVKESIPPEMLSRLIRLCHPDKHGNSESSNKATAWLFKQRGK